MRTFLKAKVPAVPDYEDTQVKLCAADAELTMRLSISYRTDFAANKIEICGSEAVPGLTASVSLHLAQKEIRAISYDQKEKMLSCQPQDVFMRDMLEVVCQGVRGAALDAGISVERKVALGAYKDKYFVLQNGHISHIFDPEYEDFDSCDTVPVNSRYYGVSTLAAGTRIANVIGSSGDREMSAAEWLFRDYFVFLARQLCRDAAARADGKTMLSDIWETLDTAGIGGMVSRYQLHGLRIPFAGINGGTEGTEQPVFALAGTLFTSVRQTDRFAVSCSRGWLDIPVSYEGKPEPDTYAMLAAFIENAKAEPQYKIMPEAPSSAPVAISFGGSYRLGSRTVWDIPTALPRGGEAYTLRFEPEGEGQTALILALTLQKTDTPGVYAICAGTADSAASLAELVRKSCPIEGAELYYKENGSYQKADTECIMAARLDLSTQTHPPQNVSAGRNAQDPSYVRLAVLLFEALATNNGGYLLIAPAKIPELAFDVQGRADMLLMLLFAECVHATERAASAVILRGTATDSEDVVLTAFAQRSRYKYALTAQSNSAVNVECAVHRTFPQEEADTSAQAYVENLYSILRYCVSVDGAAPDSAYSAPVSFTEDGMYRFALPADRLVGGGDYAAVGHTLAVHCQF